MSQDHVFLFKPDFSDAKRNEWCFDLHKSYIMPKYFIFKIKIQYFNNEKIQNLDDSRDLFVLAVMFHSSFY